MKTKIVINVLTAISVYAMTLAGLSGGSAYAACHLGMAYLTPLLLIIMILSLAVAVSCYGIVGNILINQRNDRVRRSIGA